MTVDRVLSLVGLIVAAAGLCAVFGVGWAAVLVGAVLLAVGLFGEV